MLVAHMPVNLNQTRGNHAQRMSRSLPNSIAVIISVGSLNESPLCDLIADSYISESLFNIGIKMLTLFQGLII